MMDGERLALRCLPGTGSPAGILVLGVLSLAVQCAAHGSADDLGGWHETESIGSNLLFTAERTEPRVSNRDQIGRGRVRPYGVLTGELVANTGGGIRTGSVWEGLFDFGVDIEFKRTMAESGTSLHVGALGIFGDAPSEKLVGSFNAVSNIAAFNTLRMFQAWVQKEWRDGALAIRVGQIALDDHFMVSENAALFMNSAFGPMPTESGNLDAPIFPLGAPGLWGSIGNVEKGYLQFGIYSGDAGEEAINDRGLEFGLGGSRGYAIALEAGFGREIGGMPGRYKVGGFYHTGDFGDFPSGTTVEGNSSLYFGADQALSSETDPTQGLSSFLRIGTPRGKRNRVAFYSDFGLTYRGFLPNRDSDLLGIAYSTTRFGDAFLGSAVASGLRPKAERVIELTCKIALNSRLTWQPDLQVILDPFEGSNDAFLVGMRIEAVY